MSKKKMDFPDGLESALAAANIAKARVGICGPGTPVVTVMLPKNRRGIDFAAIKWALRHNRVIFSLNSWDRMESFEFFLNQNDASRYRGRTKKTACARYKIK